MMRLTAIMVLMVGLFAIAPDAKAQWPEPWETMNMVEAVVNNDIAFCTNNFPDEPDFTPCLVFMFSETYDLIDTLYDNLAQVAQMCAEAPQVVPSCSRLSEYEWAFYWCEQYLLYQIWYYNLGAYFVAW